MRIVFINESPDAAHAVAEALRQGGLSFDARVVTTTEAKDLLGAARDPVIVLDTAMDAERTAEVVRVGASIAGIHEREEELRRRSIQQSAVANLGQIALSGASFSFLLGQCIDSIRDILHLETAAVLQYRGDALTVIAGTHGEPFDDSIADSPSGVSVPIHSGAGHLWGMLGGHAAEGSAFASHDIDFLRSVATVISQAAERRDAEDALARRARQQSAIARFGRLLLSSVHTDVFQQACNLLPLGAGVDFGFFAEVTSTNNLRLRAGNVWTGSGAVSPAGELPSLATVQAGAALIASEPLVVNDYRTDPRFRAYDDAVPHGILSGVVVPVASAERIFGVLAAHSRTADHFRQEDVDFIESLAIMLAEALEREIAYAWVEESENRFRRIFDGATEIIFSVDAGGRFTSINRAFEAITGRPRREWIGRPFSEVLAPEDRERIAKAFAGMLHRRETATEEMTIRGSDRNGANRDIIAEVTSFPRVENDRVVEVYGFARDVTDARRAAADREHLTRNLQLVLESTIEGIFTIDVVGRCTMINRAAAALFGMPVDEVLGQPMYDLLHQHDVIEQVLRTGEPSAVTGDSFRRHDGTLVPVDYSAAPILDDGVLVGAVIAFTDLRERRKLEAKLEQVTRVSGLGRLAATIAHEFNNVLMGISPFVDVIRRAPSKQKVDKALDHIANAIRRGQRITGDILRFTQPAEPVRTRVELPVWLNAIATEAQSVVDGRVTFDVHAAPLAIDADPNQLHQIFMNLILNARDAMPAGGTITLSARRDAADARFPFGVVKDPDRFAHLIAADTGTGMTEETLRHAFEPLFTTKRTGTGLGLSVAHQVVQRHGGEIFAESAPGAGTAFHIFLPLSEQEEVAVPESAHERPHDIEPQHILLVEDDPIVAAGLRDLLEFEGFEVTIADSGRAAIRAVNEGPLPDAVILDVGLPDMDGTAVFEQIAATHPELPIIFSTGHADRARLEDLLSRRHVGYLLKPYESDALMSVLSEVTSG